MFMPSDRNPLGTTVSSSRPNSALFWAAYLNYDNYTQEAVWYKIGGSIGKSYGPNSNSCAARVSWGLNYGGAPIEPFSAASVNLPDHSYNGVAGDGKRYVVSAMQMAAYLTAKWGARDHHVTSAAQMTQIIASLGTKCAVFATPSPPGGHGHAGSLKQGYTDPFVLGELPVDVWILQ